MEHNGQPEVFDALGHGLEQPDDPELARIDVLIELRRYSEAVGTYI